MKFKIRENIYSGKNSNNAINKRKYKKKAMSPFVSLDAGNVDYNIAMFNKGNIDSSQVGDISSDSVSMGEELKESHTYRYRGPVYRFENSKNKEIYTNLDKYIYTSAVSDKQAKTRLQYKLKKEFGFTKDSDLTIDKDRIELVDKDNNYSQKINNNTKNKKYEHKEEDFVGSIANKDIYYEDGYFIIEGEENRRFDSYEDIYTYLGVD